MSTTIDQKVVEMKFDNRQFESNVADSMSTINKLNQSLKLTDAAKGLEGVNTAAKGFSATGLGGAVEAVSARFSALQVMGVTALANITNSAVNAGKRIISALTIDPIKSGFSEYETKMNSIQTIMSNTASKGTTMADVTKVIGELNTYADKTIYNFEEMTRNIGTFTAAGVGLEDSAKAIQGIANLAAASGSNSQQASTAMYQLSQALATGTVKLMDWNSVVNAGMGGEKFQTALKDTAREHGVAVDSLIEKNGSFRDSLQEGWLSADILNETLSKFTVDGAAKYAKSMMESGKWTQAQADALMKEAQAMEDAATKVKTFTQLWDTLKEAAQSGWGQTWEIIIGDFEEAKALFSDVSDVLGGMIGASADARNKMLQGWKDLGGRTALIDALRNAFEGVMSIIKPVTEAFREIFPPITAQQLYNFTTGLRDLTSNFKLNATQSENLKSTFKGLFSLIDIGVTFVKEIVSGIAKLIGNFTGLGSGVLGVTGSMGDWISSLRDSIKETDVFGVAVDKVVGFISKVIDKLKEVGGFLKEKFVLPGFEGFLAVMDAIWNVLQKIGGKVSEVMTGIGSAMAGALRSGDIEAGADVINAGIFGAVLLGIKNFVGGLSDALDGASGLFDNLKGILDDVRGCFEAYQQNLKASVLLKIASAIGILAASLLVIAMIDPDKLGGALGAITVLFTDLMVAMAVFSKLGLTAITGAMTAVTTMIGMSTAVLILAAALKKIADLEWDELTRGLVGVAGLTAIVVTAAKVMSSSQKAVMKGATSMVIFGAALKILASVCTDMAALSWEEIGKGLTGVGALMTAVVIFLNTAKFSGKSIATATGIVILASALKILASACGDFAQMEWSEIGKGLTAIGILLAEVVIFTNLTGNAKHVMSTGVAMIALGAAMKIFASSMKDFASMNWSEIGRGLTGMGGALVAVTIAMNLMPKNMPVIALGLVGVAAALVVMADAVKKMGGMTWDEIGRGLTVLGGSLGILAVALNVMKTTLPGAAALVTASLALAVLAPVLKSMGSMSWGEIAKGLITLAGAFTVIGVAGLVLGPIVPVILGLSGAFALIGVGCLAAGAGIAAFAAGFTALATATAAGATAMVAALTIIVTGIANLIPVVLTKLGEGIIEFCKVIGEGSVAIAEAIRLVFAEAVPVIVDALLELVARLLESLVAYTPRIVDGIFQFLIEVIDSLARKMPELIAAVVNVFMAFFSSVIEALKGIDTTVLIEGILGIALMSGIMLALSAVAGLVPGAMVGVLGMAAVIAELALVLAAIGALASIPGLTWLIDKGGDLLMGIGRAIGGFIGGIVGGVMAGVTSSFPKIGTDLSNFMTNVTPFINGAKQIDESAMSGVKALAETIMLLTAANILEGLASWVTGGSSMSKFGKELAEFGPYFNQYYQSIKGVDGAVVASSANAAKALAVFSQEIPNSGGMASWFAGENSLTKFADELCKFGPKLKAYADSIKGLDAGVVVNSATAAKSLAEMATNLPNSGGLAAWFAGENDLSTFADGLCKFGPKLKTYADSVRGLDPAVIVNSANAAKALGELANNLPNSGGMAEWFTGDNKLSDFGSELLIFGPMLKAYATSISGLDAAVVTNSASAAKALSELANNLPNSGGMVEWFTGGNDIGDFGRSLVSFGQSFSKYSGYMKDVDAGIVTSTTNAANSIVKLQKSLPKEGGWFSDDMTLADFGNDMAQFGSYFSRFYANISSVNASQLSSVISEMNDLVKLAKGMNGLDSSGMSSFAQALGKLGQSGVTQFISAFTKSTSKVKEAANGMMNAFITAVNSKKTNFTTTFTTMVQSSLTAINAKQPAFNTAGSQLMTKFISGINSQAVPMGSTMTKILNGMSTSVKNKYKEFEVAGQTIMTKFIAGIKSKETSISTTFTKILASSVTAIRNKYSDFQSAGKYVVDGFANGISANTFKAEAKAKAMAEAALRAAKKALDEHSPSKEFYKVGDYAGQGFVDGLDDKQDDAEESGKKVAEAAYDGALYALHERSSKLKNETEKEHQAALKANQEYCNKLFAIVEKGVADQEILNSEKSKNAKKSAEELKKIQDASLATEKGYWGDLLNEKRKGEEASKYQSMTSLEFHKEILTETIDLLTKYTDAIKSNTESLMNNSGIFSEVQEKESVSSSTLTKNLKDQIAQMETYGETMASLNTRIKHEGLKEALNKMGVGSLAELEALNRMTDKQLDEYVALYDQKYALCQQAAVTQLSGLQAETEQKLSGLYGGAAVSLDEFVKSFDGSFATIKGYVAQSNDLGAQLASGVAVGITNQLGLIKTASEKMVEEADKAAKTAADIHSPSGLFRDEVGANMTEGVAEGMTDADAMASIKSAAEEVSDGALKAFDGIKDKFVKIGSDIVIGYKEGIKGSSKDLAAMCTDTMGASLTGMQTAIKNAQSSFQVEGAAMVTSLVTSIASAFKASESIIQNEISRLMNSILTIMKSKNQEFNTVGQTIMTNFIAGIKTKDSAVTSTFSQMTAGALTSIRNKYSEFYNAGKYLVEGFADGISDNAYLAERAASDMASRAARAAKDELRERSPSKVGYEIGDYFGIGFVNAIRDNAAASYEASSEIAESAKAGLSNALSKVADVINLDLDTQPTIRPVLDLSDVISGTNRLNAMFDRTHALSISAGMAPKSASEVQNGDSTPKAGATYSFTQINNSPKALSRLEIYRQTKNQFSAMKGLVEA